MTQENTSNTESAIPVQPSVEELDNEILSIMTEMTSRNQNTDAKPADTGSVNSSEDTAPVVPSEELEPEDSDTRTDETEDTDEEEAPEEVSDSKEDELIDFIELAKETPDLKFKFMRDGKEIVIDAKKAASILGQGAAVSESARELKVQKAEFEEYQKEKQAHLEGLTLAVEFTIEPKLQSAYDEIIKVQGYNATFQQQLANATTVAEQTRIRAAIEQNNRVVEEQSQLIGALKPRVDEFKKVRKQQVEQILESNRKAFKDKELKNSYVFNEIREKVAKDWAGAKGQLVPGVDNIDLISSDEHILSLIRDGLKYRDKPTTRSSGSSQVAALTNRRPSAASNAGSQSQYNRLREAAKKGDTKSQDDLILLTMQAQLADAKNKR